MTTPSSGGRSAKGGGVTPAPLSPHPASLIFPPMSDTEFKALCEDIKAHGLVEDILLLDGQILEGNNRYRACTKVGVEPRTMNWIGSDPVVFVLSKNLHRRHLTAPQRAVVAVEAEHLYEKAARERQSANRPQLAANLPQAEKGAALGHAAKAVGISPRSAQDAKKIKARNPEVFEAMKNGEVKSVRAGLKAIGIDKGPGGGKPPVTSARRQGKAKPPPKKEVSEHVAAAARIRASDAETKYQSMLNAPAGKLNIPLLDRASKIQELLSEVTGITPEKAVSGIPALRCREYSVEMAEWWLAFVKLTDARRQAETPELPTLYRRSRLAAVNPVVQGMATIGKEERHMAPREKAGIDWLRQQPMPVSTIEMATALRVSKSSARAIMMLLCASHLAEEVGKVDRFLVYQAAAE